MNRVIVGITGIPGTGKTVLAKNLAKAIHGSSLIEINGIVGKYKLYTGRDRFGTRIVNLGKLEKRMKEILKGKRGLVLVVGHLAPELRIRYDIGIVTRCNLVVLARRLEKRKYQKEKAAENIVAEAIDYCGAKMANRAKETYEVSTKAQVNTITSYLKSISLGKRHAKPKLGQISMTNGIIELVKNGNKYDL